MGDISISGSCFHIYENPKFAIDGMESLNGNMGRMLWD